MTYHRLSRILVTLCVVMTLGLWTYSLRNLMDLTISPRGGDFTVAAYLNRGTVYLQWFPTNIGPPVFQFTIVRTGSEGSWGEFGLQQIDSDPSTPAMEASPLLKFPIWLPGILLASGSLVACRLMERRARGAEEKELAKKEAADRIDEARH